MEDITSSQLLQGKSNEAIFEKTNVSARMKECSLVEAETGNEFDINDSDGTQRVPRRYITNNEKCAMKWHSEPLNFN